MKLVIDIPKEFEVDFEDNKFSDFCRRVMCDIKEELDKPNCEYYNLMSGKYEYEIAEMLKKAFNNAEVMK